MWSFHSKLLKQFGMQAFVLLLVILSVESKYREGYFNGTSYALLSNVISIRGRTTFSFRTCSDGELLYEKGSSGDFLEFKLLPSGFLSVSWAVGIHSDSFVLNEKLNDNSWHNVDFHNQLNSLSLKVDNFPIALIANATQNSYIFSANFVSNSPSLYIGRNFTGCILEGAAVLLSDPSVTAHSISWGICPISPKNGCGPSCLRTANNQCANGATCLEDPGGNSTHCVCLPGFAGPKCEILTSSPTCSNHNCQNGGTCIAVRPSEYKCVCLSGFTGEHCDLVADVCQSGPCLNNGSCINHGHSYTCNCRDTGFRGKNCEENINECEEIFPCGSGSTCFDRYGDYLCLCPNGRGGNHCNSFLDSCAAAPCKNGATCVTQDESYECRCLLGFEGLQCEDNIDDCAGVMCPHNSHCVDGINRYTCECDRGFSGNPPNCTPFVASLLVDPCQGNPCLNGGSCVNSGLNFTCVCLEGFSGDTCQTCIGSHCSHTEICDGTRDPSCLEEMPCASRPCHNGGSCSVKANSYSCSCLSGWSGKNCELNIDECSSNPCLHGQCVDRVGSYICLCTDGYGGKNCETSLNLCGSNPCQNGGICASNANRFTCACPEEYTGTLCETHFDPCISSPCMNRGSCEPFSQSFRCHCLPGFSGLTCQTNVDDCHGATCPVFKECQDLINGYECRCPTGFTGPDCSSILNPCLSLPCRNGTCIEKGSNYTCVCPSGLTGRHCEQDIDECVSNPCVNGLCRNFNGSFQCYCQPGYTGHHCHVEFDECLSNPCQNQGTCRNLVSDYECSCMAGYEGRNCEIDINECEKNFCQNEATCLDGVNEYKCICMAGFTGINCEENIDECQSKPCLNNGTCVDEINSFHCECLDVGFSGEHCEINIDDCEHQPCQNGGTCEDLIKDYHCHCYTAYEGKNCEMDIRECDSSPCLNGSPCLERSNHTLYGLNLQGLPSHFSYEQADGYLCLCTSGFTGIDCEINIDDCEHHDCVNGTCVDSVNYFNCSCFSGYEGSTCSVEINECERYQPCENGASCRDLVADYECTCQSGYGGKNCETALLGCVNSPCQNEAKCIPYLNNGTHAYQCICPLGFTGSVCDIVNTVSFTNNSWMNVEHYDDNLIYAYSLSFQFRTTLNSGILAHCSNSNGFYYVLHLDNGSVNLALDNGITLRWVKESDRAPSMNDGTWKDVSVHISTNRVMLNVSNWIKEELLNIDTISFQNTVLGGGILPLQFSRINGDVSPLVGCMREIYVGNQAIIPNNEIRENAPIGCNRTEVCLEDTCSRIGQCRDLWFSQSCICPRPYFGIACQHNVVPGTFGHGGAESWVEVEIPSSDQNRLIQKIEFSVFLRTREEDGFVFYIGPSLQEPQSQYFDRRQSYGGLLALFVESGLLKAIAGGSNGMYEIILKEHKINDGNYQFVKVFRNSTFFSVSVNETSIEESIPQGIPLTPQVLYIGGLPSVSSRRTRRQINRKPINTHTLDNVPWFKGVVQDFRINDQLVELYPAASSMYIGDKDSGVPQVFPSAVIQHNVTAGVVSDNLCDYQNPCENGGTCHDIWNAYSCGCSTGFRGYNCTEHEPCYLYDCPTGSLCQNLESGYECVAEAAFRNVSLKYEPEFSSNVSLDSISFRFRTQDSGGTILLISGRKSDFKHHLSVMATNESLVVRWNFGLQETVANVVVGHGITDGNWHAVNLFINGTIVKAVLDTRERYSEYTGSISFTDVVKESDIFVGGNGDAGDYYLGCLDNVRIGNILLPFFMRDQLSNDASPDRFDLQSASSLHIGCITCWQDRCLNGGGCRNVTDDFSCSCLTGFEGKFCEYDVDECLSSPCKNDGHCENTPGAFQCHCTPQFAGDLCEESNYCSSEPCKNGGNCISQRYSFTCDCKSGFQGVACTEPEIVTCADEPCFNSGKCRDSQISPKQQFECDCTEHFEGTTCNIRKDYCREHTCLNGATCTSLYDSPIPRFLCNCTHDYEGTHCEREVDPCKNHSCQKHKVCHKVSAYKFECVCPIGLRGEDCEVDIDECFEHNEPCQNGTCQNTNGSYLCICDPGFVGSKCHLIDPCITENHSCQNDGSCQAIVNEETNNTYILCNCTDGYEGTYCTEKKSSTDNLALAIGLSLGCICVICCLVALVVFLRIAKKKRATRGTYSPSRQEMFGSRVEMNHVMKPPPEERLI